MVWKKLLRMYHNLMGVGREELIEIKSVESQPFKPIQRIHLLPLCYKWLKMRKKAQREKSRMSS
jgi:hypothetical protein